jgi:flagellar FliJ protein
MAAERDVKKKLAMLQQYRDEYAARFRQAAQDGLGQPEWRNYQSFLTGSTRPSAAARRSRPSALQAAHTAAGQAEWQQQRTD